MVGSIRKSIRDVLGAIRIKVGRVLYEPDSFLETGDSLSREELGFEDPDWNYYTASGWSWLRRVLPRPEVAPTDVFVDFGSGKGRVVYQAAQYPFARVIGVEISEELNEVARRNLEQERDKLRCKEIELVTADAGEFEIPHDMTVAYFYNPFGGATFRKVIANILASIDRNPREVRLIYLNPEMEEALLETGRFELVRRKRGGHRRGSGGRGEIFMYASRPASS